MSVMTATIERPTEDWTPVDELNGDHSPAFELHRRAVVLAVIACATEHDGKVHISWVRDLTPAWVRDKVRGAEMSALASKGILASTGDTLPSGNRAQRNASRPAYVYRVADWDRLRAVAS